MADLQRRRSDSAHHEKLSARQALDVLSPPLAVSTLLPPTKAFVSALPCSGLPSGPSTGGSPADCRAGVSASSSYNVEAKWAAEEEEVEAGKWLLGGCGWRERPPDGMARMVRARLAQLEREREQQTTSRRTKLLSFPTTTFRIPSYAR
ncbi:hypothetical protein JCM8097_007514 [Rhodosporidiobolus ruineniae]